MGIDTPHRGKHGPCPACGGKDRFRLDDKAGRGTWFCNLCGAGDGLDLVCRVLSTTPKAAAELLAPLVGVSAAGVDPAEWERIHQQQQAKAEQAERQRALQRRRAASRAAAIAGDVTTGASPYLMGKGIEQPQAAISRTLIREGGRELPCRVAGGGADR